MKRTHVLLLLTVIAISLASFHAGQTTVQIQDPPCNEFTDADVAKVFKNLFSKPATRGNGKSHRVKFKFAEPCMIKWYDTIMPKHAVQTKDKKLTVRITKWQELTNSVTFNAPELAEWLLEVVCKHDKSARGTNIEIDVVFGIYTDEYLNEYYKHDPDMRKKLKDRITVFLVPYDRKQNKFLTDCPGDDCEVFNLGGLQP